MNPRRNFLATTAAAAASTLAVTPADAARRRSADIAAAVPDGLNPVGVRTAGVRLVPVVGGKYKVWNKRLGTRGNQGAASARRPRLLP
jgi:proline iminopeptidase